VGAVDRVGGGFTPLALAFGTALEALAGSGAEGTSGVGTDAGGSAVTRGEGETVGAGVAAPGAVDCAGFGGPTSLPDAATIATTHATSASPTTPMMIGRRDGADLTLGTTTV
jgi:hypothetical protein